MRLSWLVLAAGLSSLLACHAAPAGDEKAKTTDRPVLKLWPKQVPAEPASFNAGAAKAREPLRPFTL